MQLLKWVKKSGCKSLFLFFSIAILYDCSYCRAQNDFPTYEKFTGDFQLSKENYTKYQTRWETFLSEKPTEDQILSEFLDILREINHKAEPDILEKSAGNEMFPEIKISLGIQMIRDGDYEGAANIFQNVDVEESRVPALTLFYQTVILHHQLQKELSLKTVAEFEKLPTERVPKRFLALIELIKRDLKSWNPESLEHISRQMKVVEQHLSTGQIGEKTVEAETEVIESLDKMIEKMEEMQKKQQAKSSSSPRPSGQSAKDAKLLGGGGPGKIDRKSLKKGDAWGNLPEKQREEAIQKIESEFPSHYQNAIEQYFIKMSDGDE